MNVLNEKKVVIVTGSSSGIGRSVVEKYLQNGYMVLGIDINESKYNENFKTYIGSIADEDCVKDIVNDIKEKYGEANYLINCAGIFYCEQRRNIFEMPVTEWNSVISNNLTGSMIVTREVLPLLKSANGDKAIVFVSSDQSIKPRIKNSAYATSKGGLNVFSKACAIEFLNYGIRVNSVEPASVETNFIKKMSGTEERMNQIYQKENERMPLGIIKSNEVAELIYFLGSNKSSKITGQSLLIDSGLYL